MRRSIWTTPATYDRGPRVVAKRLYNRGYLPQDPMARLPRPKAGPTVIATFNEAEALAMVTLARTGRRAFRDLAFITLLPDTSLRIGEAMNVKVRDIG